MSETLIGAAKSFPWISIQRFLGVSRRRARGIFLARSLNRPSSPSAALMKFDLLSRIIKTSFIQRL